MANGKGLKALFTGAALALGLLVSGQSMAAAVYDEVGTIVDTDVDVLNVGALESGDYTLTLTDLQFPSDLQSLSVQLSTASKVVGTFLMDDSDQQIQESLTLTEAGSYFLTVFGIAAGDRNVGSYGVRLDVSNVDAAPVPLPLPAFLFLSGIGALAAMKRRQS